LTRPSGLSLALAALLAGLVAVPAAAQVKVSCNRGPIPQSSVINGPSRPFIRSIHETYDVTQDEARQIATAICADMSGVGDPERLLAIAQDGLKGLRRR
jgi:hypothetical protein